MAHSEFLESESLAGEIYRFMRLYDWPWSWRELEERFGEDMVELVAAVTELRLDRCLRKFEKNGTTFYEIP